MKRASMKTKLIFVFAFRHGQILVCKRERESGYNWYKSCNKIDFIFINFIICMVNLTLATLDSALVWLHLIILSHRLPPKSTLPRRRRYEQQWCYNRCYSGACFAVKCALSFHTQWDQIIFWSRSISSDYSNECTLHSMWNVYSTSFRMTHS